MKVVIIGIICIVWVQKASSAPKWTTLVPGHSDSNPGTNLETDFLELDIDNRTCNRHSFTNRPRSDSFQNSANRPGDFDPGIASNYFRNTYPDSENFLFFNTGLAPIDPAQTSTSPDEPDLNWNFCSLWIKVILQLIFFSGMMMNLYIIWKKLAKNPPRGFWKSWIKIAPAELTGHQPNENVNMDPDCLEDMKLSKSSTSLEPLQPEIAPDVEQGVAQNPKKNREKEGSQILFPAWLEFCPFLEEIDWEQIENLETINHSLEHMESECIPDLEKYVDLKSNYSASKFSPVSPSHQIFSPGASDQELGSFIEQLDSDRFPQQPKAKKDSVEDSGIKNPWMNPTIPTPSSPTAIKMANHCFVETPEFPLVPCHLVEAKISSSVEPAWTLAPRSAQIPDVQLMFKPKWEFPVKKKEQKPFDDGQTSKSDLREFVAKYKDWKPKWTGPNTTEREGKAFDDVPVWKSDLRDFVVKYKDWTPTWTGGPRKKDQKLLEEVPPLKENLREFVEKYKDWTPNWKGPNVVTTEDQKPLVEVVSWKANHRDFVDKYKDWTPVWNGPNARKRDKKPFDDEEPAWKSELRKLVEKYKGLSPDWNGPNATEESKKVREPCLPKKKVSFAEDVTVRKLLLRRKLPFVPKFMSKKMKIKIVSETVPLKGDAKEKPFKDIKLTNKIICLLLF